MTLKGGASGACASCKFQRRRCASDCPLARYFPAEQPKLFQNVHRLFGVRNLIKILEKLHEDHKPEAMRSIIFQSYIRDQSPVHGCLGFTQNLQYMIWLVEEELKVVTSQLQLYRSQQQTHNYNHEIGGDDKKEDVTSQLDLGMGLNVSKNDVPPFFSPLPVSVMSYTYGCSDVNVTADTDIWGGGQNRYLQNNNNNNNGGGGGGGGGFSNQNERKSVMAIQSQLVNLQMVPNHQQEEKDEDAREYDEIHDFLEIVDDRQSFSASKEAYASR